MGKRDIQISVRDSVCVGRIVVIGIEQEFVEICSLLLLKIEASTLCSLEARVSIKSDVCSLISEVRPCPMVCLNITIQINIYT